MPTSASASAHAYARRKYTSAEKEAAANKNFCDEVTELNAVNALVPADQKFSPNGLSDKTFCDDSANKDDELCIGGGFKLNPDTSVERYRSLLERAYDYGEDRYLGITLRAALDWSNSDNPLNRRIIGTWMINQGGCDSCYAITAQ
jgi:hypothetical protein